MAVMLFEWVFTSVFLILVVLALRAALGKRMSAGLRYGLWAVVLVRLLVPVQLFTSPIAGTWVDTEKRTEQIVDDVEKFYNPNEDEILDSLGGQDGPSVTLTTVPQAPSAPNAPDVPEPPAAPDLTKAPAWLGWVWLTGTVAVAFVLLLSNLRFYWRLRRERVPLEEAGLPLRVYVAVGLPSPCLFGMFRPAVYVTPDAAANPDMLRHVLAHEYTHYRHGDHIWSFLRCAALAAHWWNPLVWLAAVLSQRDAELACDEGALKRLGDSERAGYGNTLLALVTAKPRPGDLLRCATTMAGDKKSLKERITRIASAPKRVLWAVVVAVLVTVLASLCAFGQGAPEEVDEPGPQSSFSPAPSLSPTATLVNPADGTLPTEVRRDAEEFVRGNFESLRDNGVLFGLDGAAVVPDPPEVDGWRIESLTGPYWSGEKYWELLHIQRRVEVWNVVYSYHTTTPEKAKSIAAGAAELTEDGWLTPINYGADYLVYELREDGSRTFLMNFGTESSVTSVLFRRDLRTKLAAGGIPEDRQDAYFVEEHAEFPLSDLGHGVDLNRNGVPELVQVVEVGEGWTKYLEVWEGNDLIWSEMGSASHVAYNAVFLCTLGGEDYLLRYNPYMSTGVADYSYQLFTLENGQETIAEQDQIEFDLNFHPFVHQSFDPEAISEFIAQVNWYLGHSVQLMNTDQDLLSTFERRGRLEDDLGWLDQFEPEFVRNESKPLLVNLVEFQAAMEPYDIPVIRTIDADNGELLLCYHGMQKQFSALWDWQFQSVIEPQVLDLNGDGKDEIVFPLVEGHGTGCLVEKLYVFDAETLEQYDTSGLNQMILGQFESTGDEENFYLWGAGMDETIPKSEAREKNEYAPMADTLGMGEIICYTIKDSQVFCWLGCDASGADINYIGYVNVPVRLTAGGGFACASAQYTTEAPFE